MSRRSCREKASEAQLTFLLNTLLFVKVVDTDEHPRPVSADKMAALRPVFKKDGVVTAANASGICDGAGR